jgi:hypothetical protein
MGELHLSIQQQSISLLTQLAHMFSFGALLPLSVFYFRWKLMNSKLYRAGAIRNNVPYWLFLRKYWPRLLGTCGAWFM